MVLRVSNEQFIEIIESEPLEGVGWQVIVRYHADFSSILAVVGNWETFTFSKELSGVGGGTITLDLDDELFATPLPVVGASLLDRENLWELYEDGVLRFQFLGTKITETWLDSSTERRGVVISGPGSAWVLNWAVILPPDYPVVPPFYHTFENVSMAGQWLAFLDAAQARGTITYVNVLFDAVNDASGNPWGDSSSVQVENGPKLLADLIQRAQILSADWLMKPGFFLDMRRNFGNHLESEVIFYNIAAQQTKERERSREEIANVVVAQDAFGALSTVSDASSISDWQRRETYVAAGNALDDTNRSQVANAALLQAKEELASWTVTVAPFVEHEGVLHNKVFRDYDTGDWIGVASDALGPGNVPTDVVIEPFQIQVISGTVNTDGELTIELTLQSKFQIALKLLKNVIDKLGGAQTTLTAATPINVTQGAIAGVSLSNLTDLADVNAPAPTDNQVLRFEDTDDTWVPSTVNLDYLSDVDTVSDPPSDGEYLGFAVGSGLWVPTPLPGGLTLWDLTLDLPLTTLTGWTVGSGTWTVAGGNIQQTDTANTARRLRYSAARLPIAETAVEIEIQWNAGDGVATNYGGITLGTNFESDATGGLLVRLGGTGGGTDWTLIQIENASIGSNLSQTLSASIPFTNLVQLRIHKVGNAVQVYVNGVLEHAGRMYIDPEGATQADDTINLFTVAADVTFSNLRLWTTPMPW